VTCTTHNFLQNSKSNIIEISKTLHVTHTERYIEVYLKSCYTLRRGQTSLTLRRKLPASSFPLSGIVGGSVDILRVTVFGQVIPQ
jgi:hypothetical protein